MTAWLLLIRCWLAAREGPRASPLICLGVFFFFLINGNLVGAPGQRSNTSRSVIVRADQYQQLSDRSVGLANQLLISC